MGGYLKREKPDYNCSYCPRKDFKEGWLIDNFDLFTLCQLAYASKTMPEPGGLNQQTEMFLLAFNKYANVKDQFDKNEQRELFSGLFK